MKTEILFIHHIHAACKIIFVYFYIPSIYILYIYMARTSWTYSILQTNTLHTMEKNVFKFGLLGLGSPGTWVSEDCTECNLECLKMWDCEYLCTVSQALACYFADTVSMYDVAMHTAICLLYSVLLSLKLILIAFSRLGRKSSTVPSNALSVISITFPWSRKLWVIYQTRLRLF